MSRDINRERLFSRRAMILGGIKGTLMTGLAARLYYLQVIKSNKYQVLADENRVSLRLIPPPRGEILDRNGQTLAVNKENYRVILIPEQTQSLANTIDRLDRVISLTQREKEKVLQDARRRRGFVPITVRENLSWDEVARIEVNSPDLPGIQIEVGRRRYYPHGYETAHLIGYVGAVSEHELTGEPLLQLPDFRIGKIGIEKKFDLDLRGKAGTKQVEVNAVGRVIRELSRDEGKPGEKFDLSIDVGLQKYIYEKLGDQAASVIVMDVHNGQIYAMASAPSFDPNLFNFGINPNDWEGLKANKKKPLNNRSIAGQYAPASTFKLLVALAALEDGIDPNFKVYCNGKMDFGDSRFHCWKHEGHGWMDCREGISQSCDIYFYEIAKQLGIEKIAAIARRFGLGDQVGIDIPGERPGLIPDDAWKRKNLGSRWQKGETLIAGIGQGYILATPLQLCTMVAQLANGGRYVKPTVFRTNTPVSEGDNPEIQDAIGVSNLALNIVRQAMDMATNDSNGTAYWSRIFSSKYKMAGKTGTAQVRRISLQERDTGIIDNKDRAWHLRDHALYVGYAPIEKPRFAISVVIEHGGSGGTVAAPIARDILLYAQKNLNDIGQV